ncbi:hypothetical protein F7725_027380 [Dissostichus mawsoni]|uniref:Uncharacterized protein n=1 Tax=Dissostichus mawsoni TaxID=36200 RepID=A0A7J5XCQ4_DISMA|nr:hypothetical protein F7725_027380 [Dissostichus mawsoni]
MGKTSRVPRLSSSCSRESSSRSSASSEVLPLLLPFMLQPDAPAVSPPPPPAPRCQTPVGRDGGVSKREGKVAAVATHEVRVVPQLVLKTHRGEMRRGTDSMGVVPPPNTQTVKKTTSSVVVNIICRASPVNPQASASRKVLQDMRKKSAVSSSGKQCSFVNLVT